MLGVEGINDIISNLEDVSTKFAKKGWTYTPKAVTQYKPGEEEILRIRKRDIQLSNSLK